MRVGYVLKRYPRYSETFIVTEILSHEASGIEVEIFSLKPPDDAHFQDAIARVKAPVHYLSTEGLKVLDFWEALRTASQVLPGIWNALSVAQDQDVREVYQAVQIAHLAYQKHIDHIHAHFATSATSVARLASLFVGIPYSFTAHAKDIFHENVNPRDLQDKLDDAAGVITVSEYNARYLRENYGKAADNVRCIYNGLEIERFPYSDASVRPPIVIAVGRLVEKKGFMDLIEACGLLDRRGCIFNCQIIGVGDLENDLRARIESLGLERRVTLMGAVPQFEVIRHVGSAAVLAAPCVVGSDGNRDGLPTVLVEAMALGTPCISTDVTGIPEVVQDGKTGLIVRQHDPAGLAEAIERLLINPPLRCELGVRARKLVEEKFDSRNNAESLRSVFLTAASVKIPVNQVAW
jgi:glycosyltransferase involved in cell wall biosynthesis